ncbi:unnamed protein product [Didymodactylos carnosus]|uniref:Uncharacterized protein n=1 Tax=Didymodactylos carnosus TaxID=1234261 RepID=A0A816DDD3_9BILA|nr:unnamed protein product [Didymodactylos carnosus]CAF4533793.1 unnamed protein product [Didymodactylos carnosus]
MTNNTIFLYRRDLRLFQIIDNKEDFTLVWLDKYIDDSTKTQHLQTSLQQLNNYVQFFTDIKLCLNFIQTIKYEKLFLILSPSISIEVLQQIHSLSLLNSVFIFCYCEQDNCDQYVLLPKIYCKIVGLFRDKETLLKSIKHSLDLAKRQIRAFNLFDQQEQKTAKDLTTNQASFLWYQLLIIVLRKMPHNQCAKEQMLAMCRDYYRNDIHELEKIRVFSETYSSDKAIEWFTANSFIYRLLNKALRTEDVHLLHLFRFYITDLCT